MTPRRQLIEHDPENGRYGDCQRTCVAAVLDLEPQDVPHFCDMPDADKWRERLTEWLKARGLAYAEVAYSGSTATFEQVLDWTSRQSPNVPMIVAGSSGIGAAHVVVVIDGEIVCDPSGTGIVGPTPGNTWEVGIISVGRNWSDAKITPCTPADTKGMKDGPRG